MKKNNSHVALDAHNEHLKWTFIPNDSSLFMVMHQEMSLVYRIFILGFYQ